MVWFLWVPIILEALLLVVLIFIAWTLWQWFKRLTATKARIRYLVSNQHLQIKALSSGLIKLVEFSILPLLPRQLRLPIFLGREVLKRIK